MKIRISNLFKNLNPGARWELPGSSLASSMMRRRNEFSVDLTQKINDYHRAENSNGNISARLGVPRSIRQSIIKNFQIWNCRNIATKEKEAKTIEKNRFITVPYEVNIESQVVVTHITERLDASVSMHEIQHC